MRIDKVTLGVYGEKKNLELTFADRNFLLVHGENEAGKSTLLSFIRNILFESRKKSGESDAPFASKEDVAYGALAFQLADRRLGRIARRWNLNKKACERSEFTLAGHEMEPSALERVLSCSDRDFYTNYFGFSYAELSQGANLLVQRELSRLLYSMAAGDSELLERARNDLQERAGALFKSGANAKKPINTCIGELNDLKKKEDDHSNSTGRYKLKLDERDDLTRRLTAETEAQEEARSVAAYWRRALNAHGDFDNYQRALSEFQAQCDSSDEYASLASRLTEEEEEEYREAKQKVATINSEIAELAAEIEQSEEELGQIDLDAAKKILEYEGVIKELTGAQTSFEEKNDGLENRQKALQEEKKDLVRKLAELGALRLDATEEERASAIQYHRNLLLENILDECQEYQRKEERAIKALNDSRVLIEEETAKFEEKRASYQKKRAEFDAEFQGRALDESGEDVQEAASYIKSVVSDFEKLVQELAVLENAQAVEENLARQLLRQANDGDESYGDVVSELSKPIKPIEYERIAEETETLAQQRALLASELSSLDSDIDEANNATRFDKNEYDRAVEELQSRRNRRDALWEKVKNDWTERAETPVDERFELAQRFRVEEEATDSVSDRLFELNYALGESETIDATLKDRLRKRDKKLRQLEDLDAQIAQLDAEAAALWERFGFACCARWSRTESVAWLQRWEDWRALHAENETIGTSLVEKFTRCERAFVDAARVFDGWVEIDSEVVELDSDYQISSTFAQRVKILNVMARAICAVGKEAVSRVKRYEKLCGALNNLSESVDELEANVVAYERKSEKHKAKLDELAAKSASFCAERGLTLFDSSSRDWTALCDAVRRLRDWQNAMNAYDAKRAAYDSDFQFVETFSANAAELATVAFGDSRSPHIDVQRLENARTEARNDETKYHAIEKDLAKRRKELATKSAARDLAFERATAIRERSGLDVESFGRFLEYAKAYRQFRKELIAKQALLEASLHEKLGTARADAFLADLNKYDSYELQRKCEEAEARDKDISLRVDQLNQRLGELKNEIEALERQEGTTKTLERRQEILRQLRDYVDEYAPLQIATNIIERSLDKFKKEKIPGLLERASGILKLISNGRYFSIVPNELQNNKDSEEYVVHESTGATKKPTQLSVGTREQLFLALRLALIAEYDEHSEPLPVLMDDVLVNSDETRARRILEVLAEMATEQRQIILLSCHKSTRDAFVEIVGAENAIELESGLK